MNIRKNWPYVLLFIFVSFTAMVIWLLLDTQYNCSRNYNKLFYNPKCDYEVPSGFQIYYSKERNEYAVKVTRYEDYYLYNGRFGITTMYSSIAEPSLFSDSCLAKGYLKAYIDDQQPKFK